MFTKIFKNLSLRTRLIILTAFALVSVFAAIFVAWRLVKTTQTFTVFQTENELRAAARELAQEIRLAPNGYERESFPPNAPPKKPRPPHVERIINQYQNAFERLTAITLHPSDKIAGGFYRQSDAQIFGYVAGDSSFPADFEKFSAAAATKAAITESIGAQRNSVRKISDGGDVFLLAVEPSAANFSGNSDASAAWTIERLPNFAASDTANFAALGFLVLATFGVCIFAFATVRDLRNDTANIKRDVANLELNLNAEMPAPQTKEFAVIVQAINDLSRRLHANLAKQKQLETSLRQNEKLSALGRVASGVAHEIRNPLAAIKLKIQIAQRGEIDKNLDSTFRVVTEEIERLDQIVKRLLEFGKAQNLHFAALDLHELLRERADFFADLAAQKNVVIERENLADSLIVKGDENRLTEVFDNLLKNALNSIKNAGTITVKSNSANDLARIEISDTGVGIGADEHEKIFEPFYTTGDDGTGLGLAIAREIVEAHGGKIYFESELGRGTIFTVDLPASIK